MALTVVTKWAVDKLKRGAKDRVVARQGSHLPLLRLQFSLNFISVASCTSKGPWEHFMAMPSLQGQGAAPGKVTWAQKQGAAGPVSIQTGCSHVSVPFCCTTLSLI